MAWIDKQNILWINGYKSYFEINVSLIDEMAVGIN